MSEEINGLFKNNYIKYTSQRDAIIQILKKYRGYHLNAENIYQILLKDEKRTGKIGIATVYRTLSLFVKKGLVSKLTLENLPAAYELIVSDEIRHHHLICLNCGKVQEIDDKLTKELKDNIKKNKEFIIGGRPIKIYGYCSNCKNIKDKKR